MSLSRIVYVSRSCHPFGQTELTELTRRASAKNRLVNVTGSLIYCDGMFMQWLEGEEVAVREVFSRIANDPRHRDVHELAFRPAVGRVFPEWGMLLVNEQSASLRALTGVRKMVARLLSLSCWNDMEDSATTLMQDLKQSIDLHASAALEKAGHGR
jgi:hypothetical protein